VRVLTEGIAVGKADPHPVNGKENDLRQSSAQSRPKYQRS